MRRLSEGVEHALHCVTLLGSLPDGALLPARAMAEFHGISETYLLKQLQALAGAGVVVSVSGPRGGYRLAKPAGETTFLDVLTAIDGPGPSFRCTEIRQRGPGAEADPCAYKAPCMIRRRMLQAEKAWRDSLADFTVADVIAEYRADAHPSLKASAREWLAPKIRMADA